MTFDEWLARKAGKPVSDIDPEIYKGLKDCWFDAISEGYNTAFAAGREDALQDLAATIDKLIGELN